MKLWEQVAAIIAAIGVILILVRAFLARRYYQENRLPKRVSNLVVISRDWGYPIQDSHAVMETALDPPKGGRPRRTFMTAEDAIRIRGGLTLAEFARCLDVDPDSITSWEQDGVKTKGMLNKLKNYSKTLNPNRKKEPKKPERT